MSVNSVTSSLPWDASSGRTHSVSSAQRRLFFDSDESDSGEAASRAVKRPPNREVDSPQIPKRLMLPDEVEPFPESSFHPNYSTLFCSVGEGSSEQASDISRSACDPDDPEMPPSVRQHHDNWEDRLEGPKKYRFADGGRGTPPKITWEPPFHPDYATLFCSVGEASHVAVTGGQIPKRFKSEGEKGRTFPHAQRAAFGGSVRKSAEISTGNARFWEEGVSVESAPGPKRTRCDKEECSRLGQSQPKSDFDPLKMLGKPKKIPDFKLAHSNKKYPGDRYIPAHTAIDLAAMFQNMNVSPFRSPYEDLLQHTVFPHTPGKSLLFSPPKKELLPLLFNDAWHFPNSPDRILDAPDVLTDICTNNLDWGPLLAVNFGTSTWTKNLLTNDIQEYPHGENRQTSLKWCSESPLLASGDERFVKIIDPTAQTILHSYGPLNGGGMISLAWRSPDELSVGTRGMIHHMDLRTNTRFVLANPSRFRVCSLTWKEDAPLLATGSTDAFVRVFDLRRSGSQSKVVHEHQHPHRTAVKALAWLPHENRPLLLSGGGTFKVVHIHEHHVVSEEDAMAGIDSVAFVAKRHFIAGLDSTASQNVQLWRIFSRGPKMETVGGSGAQEGHILGVSSDPTSTRVASLSENGTLYIWKLEPPKETKPKLPAPSKGPSGLLGSWEIR